MPLSGSALLRRPVGFESVAAFITLTKTVTIVARCPRSARPVPTTGPRPARPTSGPMATPGVRELLDDVVSRLTSIKVGMQGWWIGMVPTGAWRLNGRYGIGVTGCDVARGPMHP